MGWCNGCGASEVRQSTLTAPPYCAACGGCDITDLAQEERDRVRGEEEEADRCGRCGEVVHHIDAGFSPANHGMVHGGCGGRWVPAMMYAVVRHPRGSASEYAGTATSLRRARRLADQADQGDVDVTPACRASPMAGGPVERRGRNGDWGIYSVIEE